MPATKLTILFERFLSKTCTADEKKELAELILSKEHDSFINDLLEELWMNTNGEEDITETKVEEIFRSILHPEVEAIPKVHRIHFQRSKWWAAAAILIMFGVGSYFLFLNKTKQPIGIAKTQEERFKNDVNPGGYKARLTLADGREIILDSATLGELAKQGGTAVINKEGQLVYQSNEKSNQVLYNTLSTSKGETYTTVLADGSKVWLNSASSIKYPVAFNGNERKVEITGEAYFEVAHDVSKPFTVSANGMDVQVLGTHFNINAYSDEALIKTTLLEGSVKVTKEGKVQLLSPGQQAQLNKAGEIKLLTNANTEQAIAWVSGVFDCNGQDISAIMRQVGRWYNVDIRIEPGVTNDKFAGRIPRTVSLTNLLKVLEMNGVTFTVEGKNIRVIK